MSISSSQGSVETLFRLGETYNRFEANFFRKRFAKFRQHLLSFIENITKKHFGLFFLGQSVYKIRPTGCGGYASIDKYVERLTVITSFSFAFATDYGSCTIRTATGRHCRAQRRLRSDTWTWFQSASVRCRNTRNTRICPRRMSPSTTTSLSRR